MIDSSQDLETFAHRVLVLCSDATLAQRIRDTLQSAEFLDVEIDLVNTEFDAQEKVTERGYELYLSWKPGFDINNLVSETLDGSDDYLDPAVLVVADDVKTAPSGGGVVYHAITEAAANTDLVGAVENALAAREADLAEINRINFDPLTRLPAKALLRERLKTEIHASNRTGKHLMLIKANINQTDALLKRYGQEVVDDVLRQVGVNMADSIRTTDMASRINGDEFAILATQIQEHAGAGVVAANLLRACEFTHRVDEEDIRISATLGVALYPADADTAEDIWSLSSLALSQALLEGENLFRFINHHLDEQTHSRQRLREDIMHALKDNQLELIYQPVMALNSSHMTHVEVLLRWHHPELGILSPGEFMEEAQGSGVIHLIDDWQLQQAIEQQAKWRDANLPSMIISINISSVQLEHFTLVKKLQDLMDIHDINPASLQFELSESELPACDALCRETLMDLQKLGASLSIDHFGRNDGALLPLREIPFDSIKLAPELCQDIVGDAAKKNFVSAIVGLARTMDIEVTATAIESHQQLEALRQTNCDAAQGHYFTPPMPADEFVEWFHQHKLRDNEDQLH